MLEQVFSQDEDVAFSVFTIGITTVRKSVKLSKMLQLINFTLALVVVMPRGP